ncbi:hypothetical protein CC1G_15152 [Coprinopsis cinerea okayama7|uniref:protein-tyrosine-phosphatase n=1 Tax=Coprinopsis cinerea (strain Okayama-7 / 130 / ATCC MYA-4618 / FGSC 9003) TaxID=240176 RepID=D6RPR9_COPC7|nr:hypothetical protein CC1G_15152 [Coprinopsis cinerea okayama7\|eukprot:XP_002910513.1 hypothetical protein CC1G_15152 [Coprinopsis cinerea okayama7\
MDTGRPASSAQASILNAIKATQAYRPTVEYGDEGGVVDEESLILPGLWRDMNEIVPGLWLGGLPSALNAANLKEKGIGSVVSVLRGSVKIKETFIRHQIEIDDVEDSDILSHLLPAVKFIEAELGKGRGVLVHCQAGVSRSSTVVAAYLMYTQKLSPEEALEVVRKARPVIEPNAGFRRQLDLFHEAKHQVSQDNPYVRRFYMERNASSIAAAGSSAPNSGKPAMLGELPAKQTASPSTPATESTPAKKLSRRIRCKKCRHELAAREHMLDHGQIGPPTPPPTPARSLDEDPTPTSALDDLKELDKALDASSPSSPSSTSSAAQAEKRGQDASNSIQALVHTVKRNGNSSLPSTLPISIAPDGSRFIDLSGRPAAGTTATLRPNGGSQSHPPAPPPILINHKCSGYYVEPMKWMEDPFNGETAGKITCPNKRCKAKLGNFDWAGILYKSVKGG